MRRGGLTWPCSRYPGLQHKTLAALAAARPGVETLRARPGSSSRDQVKRTPVRRRSRSAVAERAATAGMAERRPREELSEGRQRLDGSSSALVPATVRPRNPLGKHNDWPDAGFAARKHRSPAQGRLRPCRRHQRPVPALAGPRRPPAPSPRPTRSHRRRRLGPGEAPLQSCVGPPRPG